MSKNYRNSDHVSGRDSINSGNQFNVNHSGANSPINIALYCVTSSCQPSPRYETGAASLKALISEKLHRLILPALLSIADIVLWLVDKYFIDTSPWNIVIPLIMFALLIVIAGLVGCVMKDLFRIMRLK